jgi:hypothetical protein
MAWKPAPRTQQQQQAKAAATATGTSSPDLSITNDDIERMIDQIPETTLAKEAEIEATTPAPKPAMSPIPTDDEIATLISKLSPTQVAKARLQMGIPAGGGLRRLSGGAIEVSIRISADTVPVLESWAESAGVSLEEQIQQIAEQSITSYCFQDWGSLQVPAPVAAPVVTATATATAAATPPAAAPGK